MIRIFSLLVVIPLLASNGCSQKPPQGKDYRCNQGYVEHWKVNPWPHPSGYETANPLTACTPEAQP